MTKRDTESQGETLLSWKAASLQVVEREQGQGEDQPVMYEKAEEHASHKGLFSTFRRNSVIVPEDVDLSAMTSYERRNYILANQPYQKSLSQRHLSMIAIGGTLGTGLFIGLGTALQSGPLALLLGFLLVGFSIFCMIQSAAELSCHYPVAGSFATHVSRFLDSSIGFTVSNSYALAWLITFPSELVGLTVTVSYWNDTINPSVWVVIFYAVVIGVNLFAVHGFAEAEFWLSIVKIIAIIVFLIVGVVVICGGGPNNTKGYLGAHYWHDPGSFKKPYFGSLCDTFISAAYTFGGTEMVLLTANESRKIESISRAAKGTFWRISLFYISTVLVIGCLVPYTDPRLLGNSDDVGTSPFVIALSSSGSFGRNISHFMNAVILVAILSVTNSSVYAASRVIQALGASGEIPYIFGYIDKKGRPLMGIAVCGVFGLLAFLVNLSSVGTVFTWLFALCSISSFVTWLTICLSQIRFRRALERQGYSVDDIAYKSMMGKWSGYIGCALNILLIVGEVYTSVKDGSVKTFFQNCMSIPVMLVCYLVHKLFKNRNYSLFIPSDKIDLSTGKNPDDIELMKHEVLMSKVKIASSPWWYRIYRFWC